MEGSTTPKGRSWKWVAAFVVLAAAAVGVILWLAGGVNDSNGNGSGTELNTAAIQRRDLSETTTLSGTLAYADPFYVASPTGGVVVEIPDEGDVLERGASLFAIDPMVTDAQIRDAEQRVASAQSSVIGAEISLARLEAEADSADLASAQASVAQAQLSLNELMEAATEAEINAAQAAVNRAQETYDNLLAPPTEAQINAAQAAVNRAQETYDNLLAPPTEAQINAAQAAVNRAQETYDNLLAPPTEAEIEAAELAVTRADQQRQAARTARDFSWAELQDDWEDYCRAWGHRATDNLCDEVPLGDAAVQKLADDIAEDRANTQTGYLWVTQAEDLLNSNTAYLNNEASHQSALLDLENAQTNLDELLEGASSATIDNALADLQSAQELLEELLEGASSATIDNALADLQSAQELLEELLEGASSATIDNALADLQSAQELLEELQEGPDPLQVEQAQANLASSEARLGELLADPDNQELAQAILNLESAQLGLDSAQADLADLKSGASSSYLMYGDDTPWRDMSVESGPGLDILWLETNLAALGYDPGEIDEVFDAETVQAVATWQSDNGEEATGEVPLGQVVFAPGPSQVSEQGVSLGVSVGIGVNLYELTPVALVTSAVGSDGVIFEQITAQRITAQLDLVDQELLDIGTEVVIELPDDTEVAGVVSEFGAVPVIVAATSQSQETSYLDVVISPNEAIDSNWTGATVEIHVTTEFAQGALVAPVSALLALQEGGYAIEVVLADGTTQLVGIGTGIFADGYVEVSAEGLQPGIQIVVP